MANAGDPMNKPTWLQNNINLGNIITLVSTLALFSYGYGQISEKIANQEAFRTERTRQTDAKFAEMTAALRDLPNLTYRVAAQEEALKQTNARVDTSLSNISARLADINQAIGSLSTQVAVLTQRLEQSAPQRRADARPPG